MKNRRDWLKMFGAGAIIAPVIGERVEARLIETPKIEIITPKVVRPFDVSKTVSATLVVRNAIGESVSIDFGNVTGSTGFISGQYWGDLNVRGHDGISPPTHYFDLRMSL